MLVQLTETEPMNIRVCTLEELPIGLGRAFTIAGRTVALFRTRKGGVFATDNTCPHKGGPLADGMLAGDAVVCPLHAFRFDLLSGECDQPHTCPVKTYAVQQKDGDIYISLNPPSERKENA